MSLKSSFYRNRHSRLPLLPKMRTEIRVEGGWTKTLTGKSFLLYDDGNSNKILIFGTQENLMTLSELNTIYVNGTFSTFLPYFTISSVALLMVGSYNRFFTIRRPLCRNPNRYGNCCLG